MDHAALIALFLDNVEFPYTPDDLGPGEREQDATAYFDDFIRIDPGDA